METLEEVDIYFKKGEWGSIKKNGSSLYITTHVDLEKFHKVLSAV